MSRAPIRTFGRIVGMTVVAGVRRSELYREIGAPDAEAVIVPLIDDHVGPGGHVARRTAGGGVNPLVMAMRDGNVFIGGMALQADAATGQVKLCGMRLMAIAAGNAGRKHSALLEGTVIIDLVLHLSVGLIKSVVEQRDKVSVGQRPARHPILGAGVLHSELVMRGAPPLCLGLMTAGAGVAADKAGDTGIGSLKQVRQDLAQQSKRKRASGSGNQNADHSSPPEPLPGLVAQSDVRAYQHVSPRAQSVILSCTSSARASAFVQPALVAFGIEPLGACKSRREGRLRPRLGLPDRSGRGLASDLGTNGLGQ